ncbi:pilus assembly PilX family protein [Pseudomonas aegrilactucae]|uniref:Type 4 fimbrial biogenesis protein PilX N-terminal domain-containing protein n=1 Tax=Pseudomonas aegrilactucae TaxID=2854028 RepID=A0A9Q2XNI2_9PSED|nr:PilX N-terminal domain-containing pilus assembly protein [Pseudomonas aegrilactucae]MBV6289956.1 hypothetical protein [Pseudomonas aegrilactucae]
MKTQGGMVLLVSLVLMLLLALLGMSALHGATLQARMTGNLEAALQAFESAEATLRAGEARVLAGHAPPLPCVYCLPPPEAAQVRAGGVHAGGGASSGLAWQVYERGFYLIQPLGESNRAAHMPDGLPVRLYRITAVGRQRQARVVLESVHAQPLAPGEQAARRILWRQIL